MNLNSVVRFVTQTSFLFHSALILAQAAPQTTPDLIERIQALEGKALFEEACPQPQENVVCYKFRAPKDYQKRLEPNHEEVELFFSIRLATGAPKGVLMVNFGGPGLDATQMLAQSLSRDVFPEQLLERFHLLALDPRGTGQSAFAKQINACNEAALDLNSHHNTTDACDLTQLDFVRYLNSYTLAQDMDQLRQLLGETQINILGYSYGARVGTLYASLFPDQVRAMILDSPAVPSDSVSQLTASQAQGLRQQMEFVRQKLAAYLPDHRFETLPDMSRIHALVIWYESALRGNMLLHKNYRQLLVQYVQDQMRQRNIGHEILKLLPEMLHKGELAVDISLQDRIDFIRVWTNLDSEQARWLAHLQLEQPQNTLGSLMQAVLCTDRTLAEIEMDRQNQMQYCSGMPHVWVPNIKLGSSETPVMLIGNEYDPRAPLTWYQALSKQFPNAYQVKILNSIEHGSVFSGYRVPTFGNPYALDELAMLFLLDADAPESEALKVEIPFAPGVETEVNFEYRASMFTQGLGDDPSFMAEQIYYSILGECWLALQRKIKALEAEKLALTPASSAQEPQTD
jgi:pimeloyl-ACP methyl ester carboxylesterase